MGSLANVRQLFVLYTISCSVFALLVPSIISECSLIIILSGKKRRSSTFFLNNESMTEG